MILSVSQEVALQDKATLLDQLDNKKMSQNMATNSLLFIEFAPYLQVLPHYIVATLVPPSYGEVPWLRDVRRVKPHPTETKADVRRMRATILRKC